MVLNVGEGGAKLSQVLSELAAQFPELAADCIHHAEASSGTASLQPGYTASVGGQRFVSDPDELLRPGDSLLIMSADPGG